MKMLFNFVLCAVLALTGLPAGKFFYTAKVTKLYAQLSISCGFVVWNLVAFFPTGGSKVDCLQ